MDEKVVILRGQLKTWCNKKAMEQQIENTSMTLGQWHSEGTEEKNEQSRKKFEQHQREKTEREKKGNKEKRKKGGRKLFI